MAGQQAQICVPIAIVSLPETPCPCGLLSDSPVWPHGPFPKGSCHLQSSRCAVKVRPVATIQRVLPQCCILPWLQETKAKRLRNFDKRPPKPSTPLPLHAGLDHRLQNVTHSGQLHSVQLTWDGRSWANVCLKESQHFMEGLVNIYV